MNTVRKPKKEPAIGVIHISCRANLAATDGIDNIPVAIIVGTIKISI